MEKIIVGAMSRSGSTWTYNAVRLLAEGIYGRDHVNASDYRSYVAVPDARCEILKAHDPIPFTQLEGYKVITTVRDLRDAFCSGVAAQLMEIASYPRRGLVEGVYDGIDLLFIGPARYWRQYAGHSIRFEEMTINKLGTLCALAHAIWPGKKFEPLLMTKIALQLEYLPVVYSDFKPEGSYLFGRDHRQYIGIGGFLKHMPRDDAEQLSRHYAEWFEEFGYAADIRTAVGGLI